MISHQIETRVLYADTDGMGIVYYANYLRWFEMGRTALMRQAGISSADMEAHAVYLPVSEVSCKYLRSARYDEVLIIETTIDFIKRASMQFRYRIFRREDGAELVTGTTLHAFIDRQGNIVRIPRPLKEKIEER